MSTRSSGRQQSPKTAQDFQNILRTLDPEKRQQLVNTYQLVFPDGSNTKDVDAAKVLSDLAQTRNVPADLTTAIQEAQQASSSASTTTTTRKAYAQQNGNGYAQQHSEPGPSSHPRGPPALFKRGGTTNPDGTDELADEEEDDDVDQVLDDDANPSAAIITPSKRGRNPLAGSEEWQRQRKDNHKEVERRRRGNINEGINELGRIVPNGSGEKAKGAILSRAVQYIHHLKDNEARNIEKWTLEKLLMDQAMGDLQQQLEQFKQRWEEALDGRERAEAELRRLQGNPEPRAGSSAKRMRNE